MVTGKITYLIAYMYPNNQSSDFSAHLERFEFFIELNDISKEKKKVYIS